MGDASDSATDEDISTFTYEEGSSKKETFSAKLKYLLRYECADNFSPVYYVSIMGTGASSNILYNFPYPAHWLQVCGWIMFSIAVLLLISTSFMTLAGFYYHPKRIVLYHTDPNDAVYMGCYVMGYITIINFVHLVLGTRHIAFVWALWWIAIFMAVYTASIIVFLSIFSKLNKNYDPQEVTAIFLLPIVTLTVASSNGHLLTPTLPTLQQQIITELVSLMIWMISIALAFIVITIYFARLIIYKIPTTDMIFSSWLPVGFLGQSSYSILLFGVNMFKLIPDPYLGHSFLVTSALVALFLMSFGYFMVFIAVSSLLSKTKPFAKNPNTAYTTTFGTIRWSKYWWAVTFPCGTMSLSNLEISKGFVGNYELPFFRVMSCIFALGMLTITVTCLVGIVIYIVKRVARLFDKLDHKSIV